MRQIWHDIAHAIAKATHQPFVSIETSPVGGGCINETHIVHMDGQHWFVKLNRVDKLDMFEAEMDGLSILNSAHAFRVPEPLICGSTETHSYLIMEAITAGSSAKAMRLAGEQLAALHHLTQPRFGHQRDNYIGTTVQINTVENDWLSFWREHRLGYQLTLAQENGIGGDTMALADQLIDALPHFLNHSPKASLLHGDLWGGNMMVDNHGMPVIYDPAIYYGDRETDLAMTHLFNGFNADFYHAYQANYPLSEGHEVRHTLYNLYHILNHFNLFGGGYGQQAHSMMQRLLSEVR
jgi:protein-ribulosamine 3-kinase